MDIRRDLENLHRKKNYTLKAKRDRNRRLYEFWQSHQDWRIRSIAGQFGISHVRVLQILKTEKLKKQVPDRLIHFYCQMELTKLGVFGNFNFLLFLL